MRKKWLLRLLLLALMVLAAVGLDQRMIVRRYTIETDKLTAPIRLAVVADYHGCDYGDRFIPAIASLQPDAVLLVGDIFDDEIPWARSEALVHGLAERYPCYYVTGNHEARLSFHDYKKLEDGLYALGITVLRNEAVTVEKDGASITILGLDDPNFGNHIEPEKIDALAGENGFSILLSHRPEYYDRYRVSTVNLALTGHVHGGQVRIPFIGGLIAPGQGLFPKYDAGLYKEGDFAMVVSRGIGNSAVPVRVNNQPEIVVIELHKE